MKTILITVGGLLSEALYKCGSADVKEFLSASVANVCAKSVEKPNTHFAVTALFYSTPTEYDWTITKDRSIFSVLAGAGKGCAAVYTGNFFTKTGFDSAVERVFADRDEEGAAKAANLIKENDFTFIYFGGAHRKAREKGYMSDEYLGAVRGTFKLIKKIREEFPECKIIVCSDHGGHGFVCDTNLDSDVTIPIILSGVCGCSKKFDDANIIDIAPTIAKMFGVAPHSDWKGESLI